MFYIIFFGLPVVGGLIALMLRRRPFPQPWIGLGIMAGLAIISWVVLGVRTLGAVPGFLVVAVFSSFGFFAPQIEREGRRSPRVVLVLDGIALVVAFGLWVSHNPRAVDRFWDGLNATGVVGFIFTVGLLYIAFRLISRAVLGHRGH